MRETATVRPDLAKNVFQVHAVDAASAVVIRRQVRRVLVPDVSPFRSAGDLSAWLGLTSKAKLVRRQGTIGNDLDDGQTVNPANALPWGHGGWTCPAFVESV
jgi:hypothetical protein